MVQKILILTLFIQLLAANPLFLRERLQEARPGDYLVTAQKKNVSIWLVRDRDDRQVLIEEIMVPGRFVQREQTDWKGWVKNGAPGHTSWVLYAIDLQDGALLGLYSFVHEAWCPIDEKFNFFTTLFNLPFQGVSQVMRTRVGRPNISSQNDKRSFWSPPLIFEGEEVSSPGLDHFKARWPKDGTELSDKMIDIYLPKAGGQYPSYFPYWLQIRGVLGQARMRVIDSGLHLSSPQTINWSSTPRSH